jgi:hypothetical protein
MTNDELQTQLCHDLQKLSSRQALDTKIKQDNLSASKAQLRHAKWLAWEKAWDRQQEAEDNYAYAQEVQKACPCPYYATHVLEAEYTVLKRAHSVRRAQDALCVCCKGSDLEEFCCKQIAVFESWGTDPAMYELLQEQSRDAWTERYFGGVYCGIYLAGITYPRPTPRAPPPPLGINSGRVRFPDILPAADVDDAMMEKECVVKFGAL